MIACDRAWHELVKNTPALWAKQPLLGFQPQAGGPMLEMRNCRVCGSTMARERPGLRFRTVDAGPAPKVAT